MLDDVEVIRQRFAEREIKPTGCKRKDCLAEFHIDDEGALFAAQNKPVGECTGEQGACGCIHAEIRLLFGLDAGDVVRGSGTVIVNFSPCVPCAQAIIASDLVRRVIWNTFAPHHPRAPALLRAGGIETVGPEE